MAVIKSILAHPVWAGIGVIVAVVTLLVSLAHPIYAMVEDGGKCGWNEITVSVPPKEEFSVCRDVSHGVEKYEYVETVTGSSGWRGGGYNPIAWCEDVKRRKEQSVGKSIKWGAPEYQESNRKDFFGHAEYNYYCKIEASWGPIYRLASSSACPRNPPVTEMQKIAKKCLDENTTIGVRFLGLRWVGWPWS